MKGRGGPWTTKKLAKVREYLIAYQRVMLKQAWVKTVYIDAFCGGGSVKLRDAREFTEGSAMQAIGLERPFSEYHFVEKSRTSLARLRQQIEARHPDRIERVRFHSGDVNDQLPALVATLTPKHRAVIFADPYGMQLDWQTLKAVAQKPVVDLWLLVPTGMGMARLATNNPARRPKAWEARLDRFLGEKEWRDRWYRSTGQRRLFDDNEESIRTATLDVMDRDFQNRLRTIFPCVADNVLHLKKGTLVLFSLMFACSNPSPRAQRAAKNIANALLKD